MSQDTDTTESHAETLMVVPNLDNAITSADATMDPMVFAVELNSAFQYLRKRVVGIDPQLVQAMFALSCLEHILWIAGPGVAKSFTAELIMEMFPDAKSFKLQLTKDMHQDAVFGNVIPRELIESGEERRNYKGGIVDTHLFYGDELFDAAPYLLRAMLNVFNERKHRSKSDGEVDAPLHSVIATTNFFRSTGELEAVIDRFLAIAFMPPADNLAKHFRIGRGYQGVDGKSFVAPQLEYANLLALAEFIESPDGVEISNGMMVLHYVVYMEYLQRRYEMALDAFARQSDPDNPIDFSDPINAANKPTLRELGINITPRRAAKTLDFVRANAVFQGRRQVQPSDIFAGGTHTTSSVTMRMGTSRYGIRFVTNCLTA